jgi:hypothetical protein
MKNTTANSWTRCLTGAVEIDQRKQLTMFANEFQMEGA